MQSLYTLENRIRRLEKLIRESKQVGTLYHVCTLDAYAKYIYPDDTLKASGKYYNYVYKGDNYVSFTRDKFFVVGADYVLKSKALVQLVIDGDLLSEHYKIGPYNDFAFDSSTGTHVEETPSDDGTFQPQTRREKEEAVKGPIKNISKYIKEIRVDIFDVDSRTLSKMKKCGLLTGNVKYYNFSRGYQSKYFNNWLKESGIKNGTPIDVALPLFKEYIDREKFNEMLFSYDEDEILNAIKKKADLNKKYPSGYVIEEYVNDDDNVDIVKMLLDAGADPNLNLSAGTPIKIAVNNDCYDVTKLLLSYGAELDPNVIIDAAANGNKNALRALIEEGADVNVMSDNGSTPLSVAKSRQIASMLKKAGAIE